MPEKEKYICCICGKEFEGYGNNPDPVKKEGRCCDECNQKVVIPKRMDDWMENYMYFRRRVDKSSK